jgi:hypothetical protein
MKNLKKVARINGRGRAETRFFARKANNSTGFSTAYYIKMPTLSHFAGPPFPILPRSKQGFIGIETGTAAET